MDEAVRGKPGPAVVRGVLCNNDGKVLAMISKHVGCMESNEVEVVAILEALRLFASSFNSKLEVESDSLNVISWVSSSHLPPWRFQFYFNDIKMLSSKFSIRFLHVRCSANSFADGLAKLGVDISIPLVVCSL